MVTINDMIKYRYWQVLVIFSIIVIDFIIVINFIIKK